MRRQGKDVALLAYGSSVNDAMVAAELLQRSGVSATVVDARFCKPLDTSLIRRLAKEHPAMISIEEGSIGGFAAHVMQFLALDGLLDNGLRFRPMTLPDRCGRACLLACVRVWQPCGCFLGTVASGGALCARWQLFQQGTQGNRNHSCKHFVQSHAAGGCVVCEVAADVLACC